MGHHYPGTSSSVRKQRPIGDPDYLNLLQLKICWSEKWSAWF